MSTRTSTVFVVPCFSEYSELQVLTPDELASRTLWAAQDIRARLHPPNEYGFWLAWLLDGVASALVGVGGGEPTDSPVSPGGTR